ncbi:MAG: family 43 glycosylhydrolase, partial [Bacteroidaceae bacterium]|nr:family 43 glycosylhydrolase [Bacteroidaceae bacterium]
MLCGKVATISARSSVTITNPLLYSDVPDPDVICVGKDYYMVSTTMHMSPGAPIMHSRDMKHWSIISY